MSSHSSVRIPILPHGKLAFRCRCPQLLRALGSGRRADTLQHQCAETLVDSSRCANAVEPCKRFCKRKPLCCSKDHVAGADG